MNEHNGETWFNREAFEELSALMLVASSVDAISGDGPDAPARLGRNLRAIESLKAAAEAVGYRVNQFLETAGVPEGDPAEEN